jgi:hypothetical protein
MPYVEHPRETRHWDRPPWGVGVTHSVSDRGGNWTTCEHCGEEHHVPKPRIGFRSRAERRAR